MDVDLKELFRKIDSRITSYASSTPRSLAQELGVTAGIIERAVREVDGSSFREYLESKRLAHVLKIFEERRGASIGETYENRRAEQRITVLGATVSYLLHGRGIRKSGFSNPYPLYDLSRAGMACLSDRPSRPGRTISLLINCTKITETLRLEGRVVYAVASDIAGYQYRLGVRFKPFEAKRGCNPPKSLEVLTQLVRAATSYGVGSRERDLP